MNIKFVNINYNYLIMNIIDVIKIVIKNKINSL